ncbi:MAG: hypothetical protein E7632_00200 [Ruminococcaceae bacterium]|nr:hypothetical protein [Oscillospiraceae bacterium]
MKKTNKKSGLSAFQLILIITGSIIAAAGILFVILQICKKKANKKAADACCCEDELDDLDAWDIDEDILSELALDDEECCCDCADCAECASEEDAEADAE